jgi:aconitate hydratase
METKNNPFGSRATLSTDDVTATYFRLPALTQGGVANVDRLPFTVKVLLENALRYCEGGKACEADVLALARWDPTKLGDEEIPFMPARVLLQDYTGVPAVVDLAAMRSAVAALGGDPQRINPLVPVDLVIDHSVQVDFFGSALAAAENSKREYERNLERYNILRWAQKAFQNFRVVPPSNGIVHQVNIEYLARVIELRQEQGELLAFPDTLVGTDSHTTMVNGLGVLGWGVGGIEAEAVMLGQPLYLLAPQVVGFHMHGQLPEGTTATDLVLTVTQQLRKHGVVGKFVEFYGKGLSQLSLADRATLSNMAPEYGATASTFPVDDETLRYLRMTNRDEHLVEVVERYCKEQGLFRTDDSPDPIFSEKLELDLSTVEPSLAGPRRPQDRVNLGTLRKSFRDAFGTPGAAAAGGAAMPAPAATPTVVAAEPGKAPVVEIPVQVAGVGDGASAGAPAAAGIPVTVGSQQAFIRDGAVVIAAITSCTNTSNPSVMIAAGLLAKKAVERGLMVQPYVKTSLAPGSRVVTEYLREAGLMPYLEALRFHLVGYGCTTCIGNSGDNLASEEVDAAVRDNNLSVAAVLSGNRNFENRIHALVRASYLASPPLVVAYALAGTVDVDLTKEPIGVDPNGTEVFLKDIWPAADEVREVMARVLTPALFKESYSRVFAGDETWQSLPVPEGNLYEWDEHSTYIQEPPFFKDLPPEPGALQDVTGARVLVMLGDSITTDHISPASSIPVQSPAGQYLTWNDVLTKDFNQYGARRGNHEVMVRGTFGSRRLRNELVPDREGDWTALQPDGEVMRIYDASVKYQERGVPLLVIAGKEYGTGSSRDWAAKGTLLLGCRAVLAETFERIHRSNLVGMGVLPLQFKDGESRRSLGLTGKETYDVIGIADRLTPRKELEVRVTRPDGSTFSFGAIARVDSQVDIEYLRHGGILQLVLRSLMAQRAGSSPGAPQA